MSEVVVNLVTLADTMGIGTRVETGAPPPTIEMAAEMAAELRAMNVKKSAMAVGGHHLTHRRTDRQMGEVHTTGKAHLQDIQTMAQILKSSRSCCTQQAALEVWNQLEKMHFKTLTAANGCWRNATSASARC